MSRLFVISDHHFGHANLLRFEREHRQGATIEEHDDWLVARHNERVRTRDTVIFLGDVVFREDRLESHVARMNGHQYLVMGNHDRLPADVYLRYFERVQAMRQYPGVVLSHVPLHESSLERWGHNLHGHIHGNPSPPGPYTNCCVEQCGGVPRTVEEWIGGPVPKRREISSDLQ